MSVWDCPSDAVHLSPPWDSLGSSISAVIDVLAHSNDMLLGQSVPDGRRFKVIGAIDFQARGCKRLTVFDVIFAANGTTVDLLITDATVVIAHGLKPITDLYRCVELCAGMACSSHGLAAAGFTHVCSVEWRAPLVALHQSCSPGIPVVHGDIASPSSIKEVLKRVEPPFTMMTGFSCQPYLTGGAQGGSCDARSSTVPATVVACHLCQCPLLILECVTQARTNQFVRSCLQVLSTQLGYHLSEVSLKLEDNWCAKRYRWWVIASHPTLGPMPLPVWPKHPSLTVRDVMPFVSSWSPEVISELQLTAHEGRQFTLDGSSLRKYLVQMDGKLPTSLHSYGSQADACPCGCRGSFSDHLLRQRGVYAQLVQVPQASGHAAFRHLHPCELAILNAMPPPEAWKSSDGLNLRLCLSAIGQMASPMQSIWVGSCIMQQLRLLLDLDPINPVEVLTCFTGTLLACARDMFPNVPTAPSGLEWTTLTYSDGTTVRIQVAAETTAIELFQAEFALTNEAPADQWVDVATGLPLDFYSLVAGLHISLQRETHAMSDACPSHVSPCPVPLPLDFGNPVNSIEVPATLVDPNDPVECASEQPEDEPMPDPNMESAAATTEVHSHERDTAASGLVMDTLFGLRRLSGVQLASLVPPLVPDVRACDMFRQALVHIPSRVEILEPQGSAMGDDELNLHIAACIKLSGKTNVQYLDPLIAIGWLKSGSCEVVAEWIQQFPGLDCILSVVLFNDHWMPVSWTVGLCEVQVCMWEHTDAEIEGLCPLHGLISAAWGKPRFHLACTRRSFARGYCGAAAVAFAFHKLLSKDLPRTEADLIALHHELRTSFEAVCTSAVYLPKPWCWGLGVPDVIGLTCDLLKSHGVPPSQVSLRAKLVVQSLGKTEVLQALNGVPLGGP